MNYSSSCWCFDVAIVVCFDWIDYYYYCYFY